MKTLPNSNVLIVGQSGTGKSKLMAGMVRKALHNPLTAVVVLDPDGALAADGREYLANPIHGLHWRTLQDLRPVSTTHCFALPLSHVPANTPADQRLLACHQSAVRALTVAEQVIDFGVGEYGPRLFKLFYLGAYGLSLTDRPFIDLPALYTLDGAPLRNAIGNAFPFQFLSDEWRALDLLGTKNLNRFLEYRDSLMSRCLPIFGNPMMSRVFGPQQPVDIGRILAERGVISLDLDGIEHKDAVLIGSAFISLLFHEALRRPADRAPYAAFFIDECFDYLTPDLCRSFDRLRKRHVQLVLAAQRLGQFA